jgi:hypothetical protein
VRANKISVALLVAGLDFDPDEITKHIGLPPSETHRFGEPIGRTKAVYKLNMWRLRSRLSNTTGIQEQIKDVLDQLSPVWSSARAVSQRYQTELECVVYVYDHMPELHFDAATVDLLAQLNCDIDLDIYVMPGMAVELSSGGQ